MSIREISNIGLWAVEIRIPAWCGMPPKLTTNYFGADSAMAAISFSQHKYPHYEVTQVRELGDVFIYTEVRGTK